MQTALVSALVMFAIAAVISMGVALLIKAIFIVIRKLNTPRWP